jgi:hypothetical protein
VRIIFEIVIEYVLAAMKLMSLLTFRVRMGKTRRDFASVSKLEGNLSMMHYSHVAA